MYPLGSKSLATSPEREVFLNGSSATFEYGYSTKLAVEHYAIFIDIVSLLHYRILKAHLLLELHRSNFLNLHRPPFPPA